MKTQIPKTTDEILEDIRKRNTPKNDKYGGPRVGVFLYNCGWIAFDGEYSTSNFTDESFKTSYEAALSLWKKFAQKVWMIEFE